LFNNSSFLLALFSSLASGFFPTLPSIGGRDERLTQLLVSLNERELLDYKGTRVPTLTDTKSQLRVQAAVAFNT